MLEIESKLMFEAERCARWVVVVIDKVADLGWDCDVREISMGGGIETSGPSQEQ